MNRKTEKQMWRIDVPIFRHPVIIQQLGIAIGIPFSLLILMVLIVSGNSIYTLYALGLIGTLFFLTWLFLIMVYRGQYAVEFTLDDKGVRCYTQTQQTKKNHLINTITVIFGLLSGKPTVVGAGLLAQSRQSVFLNWQRIRKVSYQPQRHTILLRGAWTENIALFCTAENYLQIEQIVKLKTKSLESH
ncbi:hypothetical protein [Beggiatoa leptomitoformis]|uniref:Uncharacterized protein n=1 Tax=Beggiatoa leptomitoformis TaxID=288004 RepID=A0A2N9YGQ1_9GAMM|nr:hypothetical protein [Beggiatoa leptomitoformis]ALG68037.1 hypothetical protein AL038_10370 [Beggiatoa leptomitoformis]AUI69674.1 hypothetical protein BLE401_13905 [Beggiatoa leptomitoformis]